MCVLYLGANFIFKFNKSPTWPELCSFDNPIKSLNGDLCDQCDITSCHLCGVEDVDVSCTFSLTVPKVLDT